MGMQGSARVSRSSALQGHFDLAKLIVAKGANTPRDHWVHIWLAFQADVHSMDQPLGHGTSLRLLPSIIEHGLGSIPHKPASALMPETNSVVDLRTREGLLACYCFATRYQTNTLSVDSGKITKCKGVALLFANCAFFKEGWWGTRFFRRRTFKRATKFYLRRRGQRTENDAAMLVYNGEARIDYCIPQPQIASELYCDAVLTKNLLRYALVPSTRFEEAKLLIRQRGALTTVLPIELLGLDLVTRHLFPNEYPRACRYFS